MGDVVSMLTETPQFVSGHITSALYRLLTARLPASIVLRCLKWVFVLFATEDPEFLDEVWYRDDGAHRASIYHFSSALIGVLAGAVRERFLTPAVVQEGFRILELIADDSNFKAHIIKHASRTLIEFLSYPPDLMIA